MDLDLAGKATVKHIQMRKEFAGEDKQLGVDIKLKLVTDLEVLALFSPTLRSFLYDESGRDAAQKTAPILLQNNLEPLKFSMRAENHSIAIGEHTFEPVVVDSFEIEPEQHGAVIVHMKVSIKNADPDILPDLAAIMLDEVANIDIEPMQGSLLKDAA